MNISNIDKGNAIVRRYKACKYRRNFNIMIAGATYTMAAVSASKRHLVPAIINGQLACWCIEISSNLHKIVKQLEPEYKAIKERAKKIYS